MIAIREVSPTEEEEGSGRNQKTEELGEVETGDSVMLEILSSPSPSTSPATVVRLETPPTPDRRRMLEMRLDNVERQCDEGVMIESNKDKIEEEEES